MITRIVIVNEGPENIVVQNTGCPVYIIGRGQHQAECIYEGIEVHIKESTGEEGDKKPA